MPSYRPRHHAVLTVPTLGTSADKDRQAHGSKTIDLPIRLLSSTLERNDHLTADSLHITAEWNDAGVDPRFLKNATIQYYAGTADDDGTFTPSDANLRFTGVLKNASRKLTEGGLSFTAEFLDYTTLFVAQKPYPATGVPHLNCTLTDAWHRICEHTGFWSPDTGKIVSNVEALRDSLEFRGGVDGSLIIGNSLPKRLSDFGRIGTLNGDSAWDVWQHCVYGLGLISFIENDKVVVTTSTEHFAATNAPTFLYGNNILEAEESVDTNISNKGIGLTAYDHSTGKTIEAFWPPGGDVRINVKRSIAKRKGHHVDDVISDQYEMYEYNELGITDPAILLEVAKRAYAERSRQEIQGYIKTAEMYGFTPDGTVVDMLDLRSGDCIAVSLDPDSKELLKNTEGLLARVNKLVDVGYERDVANLLAANLDAMDSLDPIFHTRSITTTISEDNFEVSVKYWNRIKPVGGDSDDQP